MPTCRSNTLLRSFEDLFGLSHLGYAGLSGGRSLGSDVFNRACRERVPVTHIGVPALASSAADAGYAGLCAANLNQPLLRSIAGSSSRRRFMC